VLAASSLPCAWCQTVRNSLRVSGSGRSGEIEITRSPAAFRFLISVSIVSALRLASASVAP
jgi:hypothetical protein